MADDRTVELSVIIPAYNEQDSLEKLYDELNEVLSSKFDYEIIFVDDGSSDNTFNVLREIRKNDPKVRVIRFRKNFGQTAALAAGFENSCGSIVIPLDADGQNDPADIPRLVNKLNEGYDIVSGWRKKRHDNVVTRTLPSRIANWIIARITGVKLHDFGCTLKAYRWESIKEIRLYGEMHRFIPALASWGGENVAEMVVNHRPRATGKTKYGLNRTFKVILDLMTIKFLASFSTKPIYVFGGLGVLSALGAFVSGILVLYYKFVTGLAMNRNPLLFLTGLLVIASIQFILMGLLAELLVRTYHESQGRQIYVIDTILQAGDEQNST
ncbi:MAG: glycosyltransferase family 2 protein [Planctomycetes bacterium]|nr:glycosyltransferase family 2 protein [Planctomycetota bacterium]